MNYVDLNEAMNTEQLRAIIADLQGEIEKCLELGVLVQEAKDALMEENLRLRRRILSLEAP